jgi:hypothetical protein
MYNYVGKRGVIKESSQVQSTNSLGTDFFSVDQLIIGTVIEQP